MRRVGLGITEAAIMMQAGPGAGGTTAGFVGFTARYSASSRSRCSALKNNSCAIPKILSGEQKMCFAVTEPNVGLDTTKLKTRAEKVEGGYRVNGEKIWITNAHVADKMMPLLCAHHAARRLQAQNRRPVAVLH